MDTVTLVEDQIDAGRALLTRLKDRKFPIAAACWIKPVEEDRWTLFIATPVMDEKGPLEAYRAISESLRAVGEGWVTSSNVTLVGVKEPSTREAIERLRRHPGWLPPQFPGVRLGGVTAEDVYVYPLGEVEVTIHGLTFRGDPSGVLHLSFEPPSPHSTFTIEGKDGRHEYPAEIGLDWVIAAPEGAVVERDERGPAVLAWDLHGRRMRSTANEVFSLAKLRLHGFRIVREPVASGKREASAG
jgi:hypothetical protein